jgi:two-component system sensor histidine kinase AlgZ
MAFNLEVMADSSQHWRITFWPVQLLAWSAFGAISILGTLVLPDRARIDAYYTSLTLSGFLATLLLRVVYRGLLRHNLSWTRLSCWVVAVCYALAIPQSWFTLIFEGFLRFRTLHPETASGTFSTAFSNAIFEWVLLLAWSVLYFGIKQWQAAHLREEQFLRLEAMAQSAQLRALRYQITPHFLFNTLNSISTLVGEGNSGGAREMIALLGDFLRDTLAVSDTGDVTFAQEMLHVGHYLAIEQVRLGDRLKLSVSIDPAIQNALVPSLILQPLVENSILHGIARCSSQGMLSVEGGYEEDAVKIRIVNTIKPSSMSREGDSLGMGLQNTKDRLAARYGDAGWLEVRSEDPLQWTVVMTLPLETAAIP